MDTIQATADRGYYKGEDIAACEAAGVTAFVPKPLGRGAAASKGLFPKEAFTYDAQMDTYRCLAGQTLFPKSQSRTAEHRRVTYYHREACRACALRPQCTSDPSHRKVARWEGEAVLDAMAERLAANPQMTRRRRETVEDLFGTIKHAMNQGHFLLKGLHQVRAEFSLSALAYNLLRVINTLGVQKLVEALRRRLRALARALQRVPRLQRPALHPRVRLDHPPRAKLGPGWSVGLNEPPSQRFHTPSLVFAARERRGKSRVF